VVRRFLAYSTVRGYRYPFPVNSKGGEMMTGNARASGLVFATLLMIGVFGAQGASAHEFTSSNASIALTGANESYTTGSSRHIFAATGGLTVSCDVTLEGTQAAVTQDTVTLHPKYHNCISTLGGAPTVDTNGCNYIFDSDTTTNTHPSGEHAAVSLECEGSHVIEITAPGCNFAFAATHNSVSVNQSLHGIRYSEVTHSGKKALTALGTIRTIQYTATTGSLCGLAGHPAGTYSSGSYDAYTTVTGYTQSIDVSGSTTEGRVRSHGGQVDIAVGTPVATEHSFKLGAEDSVVTGHLESEKQVFQLIGGFELQCSVATFEGTNGGTLRDTLTLHPKYASCTFAGVAATVDTDGCNYVFDSEKLSTAHNVPNEHAAVSIECETEHHIVVTASFCKITISATHDSVPVNQALHGVRYGQLVKHGPGSKHALTMDWTVQGLHYTALEGSSCGLGGPPPGTYTNGTISGEISVTAYGSDAELSGGTTTGRSWSHGSQVDLTFT
jgi:hypothetical protein